MCGLDEQVLKEDLQKTLEYLEELKARRADEIRRWEEYVETVKTLGMVTQKDVLLNIAIMIGIAIGAYLAFRWMIDVAIVCGG